MLKLFILEDFGVVSQSTTLCEKRAKSKKSEKRESSSINK